MSVYTHIHMNMNMNIIAYTGLPESHLETIDNIFIALSYIYVYAYTCI